LKTRTAFSKRSDVAIVAHLYYMDWFDELATTISRSPIDVDVFISLRADIQPHELAAVRAALPHAYLLRATNRGRDWQPFIQFLPALREFGYVAACKIHSKKSLHLKDGSSLRKRLLGALMSREKVSRIVSRFRSEPRLGMVVPAGARVTLAERDRHVLNTHWLDRLLPQLGAESQIGNYSFDFVAGSMFWFRPAALSQLAELKLDANDFERELGQVDGTLAHALERLALFSAQQTGYLSEVDGAPAERQTQPA
jgi:lipopolysaccharide biosynthesis protein